ncbi:MAG: cytochrome P450 [Geminicoccaceae bacterium]|nr:cytochrome P450 [Geminicoccaceae bacterium]
MPSLPRDPAFDASLALLSDPYGYIARRCEGLGGDAFRTRIMLRPVVCGRGERAARMFYGEGRFTRKGAMPKSVLHLLQDEGSVQGLDDAAHARRKALFMEMMTEDGIARLADLMVEGWRARLPDREGAGRVVLHDAAREILCGAVCAWAGIPAGEVDAARRARELGAMVDAAGAIGPRNWGARLLRHGTERWARGLVERARAGGPEAGDGALARIARHRDLDGRPLDPAVAAVELLNVLRPTVAVAHFVVFAALALERHPECRERLAAGDEDYLEGFVREVRRTAPFFPLVAGRARRAFDWEGHCFEEGAWMLLDIYGTDNDPKLWPGPDDFDPLRHAGREPTAYDLIPQGGGPFEGHRCPGEWIAIALTKAAVRLLTREIAYAVPPQDLTIDRSRAPALPRSGFVIADVRKI